MQPWQRDMLGGIAAAANAAEIDRVCSHALARSGADQRTAFRDVLATALHAHLSRRCLAPGFREWVDTYFGRSAANFRHPLQRPTYLYYPALPPQAWHAVEAQGEWQPMRGLADAAAAEVSVFAKDFTEFQPYVGEAARNDATWKELSGRSAWSSIHLLRPGVGIRWLDVMPATRALLDASPLAQCPPHAPECFVSRLEPGVTLPPHYGLSNIKLTVHVPVDIPPDGCSITVGGQMRSWKMGDLLVFDDSFLHSAANVSDRKRTVLIFDVWHPALATEERDALAYAITVLDVANRVIAA